MVDSACGNPERWCGVMWGDVVGHGSFDLRILGRSEKMSLQRQGLAGLIDCLIDFTHENSLIPWYSFYVSRLLHELLSFFSDNLTWNGSIHTCYHSQVKLFVGSNLCNEVFPPLALQIPNIWPIIMWWKTSLLLIGWFNCLFVCLFIYLTSV